MFDRRLIDNFDWILLGALMVMGLLSVLNLYSATSSIRALAGSQIYVKQICWYGIGFLVLLLTTTFDYHVFDRLAYPLFFLSLALLLAVLHVGKVTHGSQRWLSFGFLTVQPSEMAKVSTVLVLAKYFSSTEQTGDYRLRDLWRPFILIALPFVMIVYQPDLGTALVLLIVSFSIILFVHVNWKSIVIFLCIVLVSAPFLWMGLEEYQKKRIMAFLRPDMDPLGSAYHVTQSKIAIGSGLFLGEGLSQGNPNELKFSASATHRLLFFRSGRGVGLCGLGHTSDALPIPHTMVSQHRQKQQGQIWRPHCSGRGGLDFLAPRHQREHGYRPPSRGGHTIGPV
jgi:rod shape determining protein RodA